MIDNNPKLDEVRQKIKSEYDYINSKKHKYSLSKFLEQNPNGTTDNIIAYFLCITTDEVKNIYGSAVEKIRQKLKIGL